MTVIYALIDPMTREIRYVGKTSKQIIVRLKKHMNAAKHNNGSHLFHWLRDLDSKGLTPATKILEEVKRGDDWRERERYWIAYGRKYGWPLTNATDGGDGLTNPTQAVREKLSIAARGNSYASGERSEAFKERMAQAAKETKNALGHEVSQETKENISEKLKVYFANGGDRANGERCGRSKLTEADVLSIRSDYAAWGISLRKLGDAYGVNHETIRKIVIGETWAHI